MSVHLSCSWFDITYAANATLFMWTCSWIHQDILGCFACISCWTCFVNTGPRMQWCIKLILHLAGCLCILSDFVCLYESILKIETQDITAWHYESDWSYQCGYLNLPGNVICAVCITFTQNNDMLRCGWSPTRTGAGIGKDVHLMSQSSYSWWMDSRYSWWTNSPNV